MYPSKKGFRDDTKGLPWDLKAYRISSQATTGAPSRTEAASHSRFMGTAANTNTIILSDSMLRFLGNGNWGGLHRAEVIAVGGATLGRLANEVRQINEASPPGYLIFHGGINNISRGPSARIRDAREHLETLAAALRDLQASAGTAIILTQLVTTQLGVNERVAIINQWLAQLAAKERWLLIDTQAITAQDLEDGLHLNRAGQQKMFDLLERYI